MGAKTAYLIDIAVNLTDSAFQDDLDEVLLRARASGIEKIVVTASNINECLQALELCQLYPQQLACTAGVHPHHAKDWQPDDQQRLRKLLSHPAVHAVGETGLDYNRDFSPRPRQREVFEQQLQLAADSGYPILLHERDAHEDFVTLLARYRRELPAALLHCFTGSKEELTRYRELDLYIGITGWICDERRGLHLRELIKEIPADRLLLETDSPYLLPRTLKPKPKSRRNEPAYLSHICAEVAAILGITSEELAARTSRNAERFFNLLR
ncbi:TatD family hydrolase [Motiliproteus sediminis]|uniref:TatD family hydrolase n=1 Tax=Motiliproteus sediminis TaxID=1468178 RepID=UPI001AEFE968|nr:TatD family hydrolase [Motiliproteus sediminis]